MAATQIKKMKEWHNQLIDWLIANPRANLSETSAHFEVSPSWISTVKNSDAFQAIYAERRKEISSEVCATVRERTTALAEVSIDVYTERLHASRHNIPLDKVRDAVALSAEMLGITHRTAPSPAPTTQVNIGLVDPEALAEARRRHHERLGVEESSTSAQMKLINESIDSAPAALVPTTE